MNNIFYEQIYNNLSIMYFYFRKRHDFDSSLSNLWLPSGCFSQGLALFLIDFAERFSCHSSSFGVSHTENIISLNSSIDTTVSWNWLSQNLNRFVFGGNIYAIEGRGSTINAFWNGLDFPRLG